jgi:hypothetical protein
VQQAFAAPLPTEPPSPRSVMRAATAHILKTGRSAKDERRQQWGQEIARSLRVM